MCVMCNAIGFNVLGFCLGSARLLRGWKRSRKTEERPGLSCFDTEMLVRLIFKTSSPAPLHATKFFSCVAGLFDEQPLQSPLDRDF